ncbi:MAG: hypothetical protein AB7U34_06555 [Novosphingobium sp.]
MSSRRIVTGLLVLLAALLIYAWVDGGEEPVHDIVAPVTLPQSASG